MPGVYYTHFVASFILVLSNHSHHSMLLLLFTCVHACVCVCVCVCMCVCVCIVVVICVKCNYISCNYNTWVQKEESHQMTILSSINIHVIQPGSHMVLYITQDL